MGRGLRCLIPIGIVYFLYSQFIFSLMYTASRHKSLFSKLYDTFKTNWHKLYDLSFILSTKTFLTVAWNLRYSGLKLQITNPHSFLGTLYLVKRLWKTLRWCLFISATGTFWNIRTAKLNPIVYFDLCFASRVNLYFLDL